MKYKDIINKKCQRGLTIKVMKSNAGFYVGTGCGVFNEREDGNMPMCRLSFDCYNSKEDCLNAEVNIRCAEEIKFCNHGLSCFKEK